MAQEFMLQEGEKVIQDITPIKRLLYFMTVKNALAWMFAFLFLGGFLLVPIAFGIGAWIGGGIGGIIGGLLSLVFILGGTIFAAYITAWLVYSKRHYWITNKRVIFKTGFLGYTINSVPLERISDVMVSRSFIESIFGFGSVHIQSMAGQYNALNPHGSEAALEATPNPEEAQQLIFNLIKKKRTDEKITM